jgi:hypothetical protein
LGSGDNFWQSYEENQVTKISHTICHRTFKTANLRFARGKAVLLKETVNLENFPSSPTWQILK